MRSLRWGIVATGSISGSFVYDIENPDESRKCSHSIAAVASSTSVEAAQTFISRHCVTSKPTAYGSYEELAKDPNVDIVYIATPHGRHFEDVKLCLEAGKNVLCEKPFTINAKDAEELISLARSKNLFLLDGVWSRFMPVTCMVKKLLLQDRICGNIKFMFAEFGKDKHLESLSLNDKFLDPKLGAGSFLNLGVYTLTWARLLFGLHPTNNSEPTIHSSMQLSERTFTDESTTVVLTYPDLGATVICRSSHLLRNQHRCIRVDGDNGKSLFLTVGASRPSHIIIQNPDGTEYDVPFESHGEGFSYEQDEVFQCIEQRQSECPTMSWEETLYMSRLMDQIREKSGLVYPHDQR
jgi:dihydrodiol dehydrogenase / D-xylose 1-dehydrogenase (NADP)